LRSNGQLVLPELAELDVEGRLEDEPRQEDGEEQLLREVGRLEGMHHSERESRDHQRHRVGKLEIARRDRHRCRDGEEQHEAQLEVYRPSLV
jgi:hypothetical protein